MGEGEEAPVLVVAYGAEWYNVRAKRWLRPIILIIAGGYRYE